MLALGINLNVAFSAAKMLVPLPNKTTEAIRNVIPVRRGAILMLEPFRCLSCMAGCLEDRRLGGPSGNF